MSAIIAVDVDDCIIDMRPLWINYCQERFGYVKCPITSYNLCDYWGEKAMDFWSNETLYDNLTPNPQAAKTLSKLNDLGYEIGFCSYTKKGHFSSKCDFINAYFPYRKFILNTKEKNYTRCDWFIDDRSSNLIIQPSEVNTILYKTNVENDERDVDFVTDSWEGIYSIIVSN